MKTIKLTDDQFNTLFEFVDQKVECIAEASYLDSEILEEWEDLIDVHTLLEELSKFDYDDNLVLYFLKNDELKSCQLESIIDANYEDDEGFTHVELTIEETEL